MKMQIAELSFVPIIPNIFVWPLTNSKGGVSPSLVLFTEISHGTVQAAFHQEAAECLVL